MKNTVRIAFVLLSLLGGASVQAEDFATAKDAEAIVGKAAKALAADHEGTLKQVTGKDAKWVHGDLYVVVYDLSGKCLAHGQNEKQVGKDLIDLADADGKEFIKERMQLAQAKGKFWQDYKFTDPVTKKVLPKSAYCELAGKDVVCAGIYKR
ncbi:Cache domain-containing protein [Solimonas aquatica]|uniref:Cache domain-containing protein n=1 Tax=Solimonas aquatica TaxID=489703 RepID=A0A1H9ASX6_9GAMM|nr:cache domain-containing protein [Solimonas aquatica]SEP79513.1 Cache domain-containing protein [Solimonas aquatica]